MGLILDGVVDYRTLADHPEVDTSGSEGKLRIYGPPKVTKTPMNTITFKAFWPINDEIIEIKVCPVF